MPTGFASGNQVVQTRSFRLMLHLPQLSFTDAYFETMSGLTTTGATVLTIDATTTLTANPDGTSHVRTFGQNTFGFEDMNAATPGVDFDYNDMIVKLSILA